MSLSQIRIVFFVFCFLMTSSCRGTTPAAPGPGDEFASKTPTSQKTAGITESKPSKTHFHKQDIEIAQKNSDQQPAPTTFSESELRIVEKPILWDAERNQLSLQYLALRHGIQQKEPAIAPIMVVIHATEGPTVDSAFYTFYPTRMKNQKRQHLRRASELNVSAHFLVDRNGDIYRLLPETRFARHTVGLNYCAIGIENVGGTAKWPLTDEQVEANARLIRHLVRRFPLRYVIGHHEYLLWRTSTLWKETDPTYYTIKTDPGADFMHKLRTKITDLNLQSTPLAVHNHTKSP